MQQMNKKHPFLLYGVDAKSKENIMFLLSAGLITLPIFTINFSHTFTELSFHCNHAHTCILCTSVIYLVTNKIK